MRRLLGTLAVLVAAVAALGAAFLVGMRRKSPAVLDAVRRMNRAVMNPAQLRTAGTPGAYAAIIRHTGRVSGQAYETPVGAVATDDGFVITLPYGTRSDWLRNVLAAGSAELVHEGATHAVDRPELVPTTSVLHLLPPGDRTTLRLFKVEECLTLHRAEA